MEVPRARLGARSLASLAGALALCCGWTESVTAQSATLASVRDSTLDNGLDVIVVPSPNIPIAFIELVVRSGAFTQREQADEGLPHVLEHMLFKRKGGDWWSDRVWDLRATYNAMTSAELVAYYLALPSEKLDAGIGLLAELVRSPGFSKDALEDESKVVQEELRMRVSDPHSVAETVTQMALWGPAFRQKNVIGNMLTIGGVTTDQLERHVERYYVPNNAALIVTGDVDAARTLASAAKHFGRWRRSADPFQGLETPPITPLNRDSVFVVQADASNVTFMIRWHGPAASRDRDASYAADLFSAVVNQPTSQTQVRLVRSGLFTDVSLQYVTLNHVGPIALDARTTPDVLGQACAALVRELDLLGQPDYFTDADLEAAIKRLRVAAALEWQSAAALAHSIARYWSVIGLDAFRDYFDALSAQTAEGVRRYVAEYITGKSKVVSILMSSSARRLKSRELSACLSSWRAP
jgi:zinc protease